MSEEHMNDEHDDIVLEPDPDTQEDAGLQNKIKKLREDLKKAQAEAKENLDGWQRARADYSNLQKQIQEERASLRTKIERDIMRDILTPLDTFEMAMSNKEVWEAVDEKWRQGIEYIYSQFNTMLNEYEVAPIEPQAGDDFNPEEHESLEVITSDNPDDDGKIITCKQKGYSHKGSVIRPAKVTFYTSNN